jgi:hypothetical protein
MSMENDEMTYFDNGRKPQIHGNGTEDDFNQGWSGNAYQQPLWGAFMAGFRDTWRIYYNDCYAFNNHILITTENEEARYEEFGDDMSGTPAASQVTYYYKSAVMDTLALTDKIDVGNQADETAHKYTVFNSDGEKPQANDLRGSYDQRMQFIESCMDSLVDDGYNFNNYCQFTVAVSPDNSGVRLRRRANVIQKQLQTSTVYVDNVKVIEHPWFILTTSDAKACGWVDTDFDIPETYTKGKSSITVKVEYVKSQEDRDGGPGKFEQNDFYYWIFSYPKVTDSITTSLVRSSRATTAEYSLHHGSRDMRTFDFAGRMLSTADPSHRISGVIISAQGRKDVRVRANR